MYMYMYMYMYIDYDQLGFMKFLDLSIWFCFLLVVAFWLRYLSWKVQVTLVACLVYSSWAGTQRTQSSLSEAI